MESLLISALEACIKHKCGISVLQHPNIHNFKTLSLSPLMYVSYHLEDKYLLYGHCIY